MTDITISAKDASDIAALLDALAVVLEAEDVPAWVASAVTASVDGKVEWSRHFTAHDDGGITLIAQEAASQADWLRTSVSAALQA